MAYQTQIKDTYDLSSARRIDILGDKIIEPFKNARGFLATLMKLNKRPVSTTKPTVLVNTPLWQSKVFYAAGAGTWSSGAISGLAIDDGSGGGITWLKKYNYVIIKHAAGGTTLALVTAVNSSTSIDLLAVSASPTNIADNDSMQVIGTAYYEGADNVDAVQGEPSTEYSFTEIFIDTVEVSGSLEAQNIYGGNEYTRLKAEAMTSHVVDINRAFLHSDRGEKTISVGSTTKTVRTTYGLIPYTSNNSSNIFSVSYSSYTFDDFIDDLKQIAIGADDGSGFTAIAGSNVIAFLSKMGGFWNNAQFNIENGTNAAGVEIYKIRTPFGTIELTHELALNPLFADYMLIFRKGFVEYAPLVGNGKNRDTQFIQNFEVGGDKRIDAYLTEAACLPRIPAGFGLFTFS